MKFLGILLSFVTFSNALYSSSDDVVELTAANFRSEVIESDELWLVEFYAPWCGHCKNLAPEWKKAATNLKGIVHVGAVDMDQHGSVGSPYGIKGFPTIKAFGFDKNKPKDYNGGRDANSIEDYAYKQLKQMVEDRKGGKKSGGGGGGSGGSGGSAENHVVELTDDNFKELVLDSDEPWLVEFYAPWCGHCKRLEPEWKAAANELHEKTKGAVKMGAVDATIHQRISGKYGIQGFPTIKIFRKGAKDSPDPYEGGRDKAAILSVAEELYEENIEPPKIEEIVSAQVLHDNCIGKQLCVISFLEHILDTGAEGRNKVLDLLSQMGDKYKRRVWGWTWTEAGKQQKLQEALGIGGSGFPAMVVVVEKKKVFTVLAGPFNKDGIEEFLDGIAVGRAGRNSHSLPNDALPDITECDGWDGKDGQLPEEDDIDLSDFKWDDEL